MPRGHIYIYTQCAVESLSHQVVCLSSSPLPSSSFLPFPSLPSSAFSFRLPFLASCCRHCLSFLVFFHHCLLFSSSFLHLPFLLFHHIMHFWSRRGIEVRCGESWRGKKPEGEMREETEESHCHPPSASACLSSSALFCLSPAPLLRCHFSLSPPHFS